MNLSFFLRWSKLGMGGGELFFFLYLSFLLLFAARNECCGVLMTATNYFSSHKLRQSIVLTWEETVKLGEPVLEAVQKRASDLRNLAEQIPP